MVGDFQDDSFLPFTINSAIAQPTLSRRSLDGDVRPTMVNLTLVNNFRPSKPQSLLSLLATFDNKRSASTTGTVRNDQNSGGPD
jgi:hypothetical protein